MTVAAFGSDVWVITFPSFNRDPQIYANNPEFQMSYEFATFIRNWDLGDFGTPASEFHRRNFEIAIRKSCYSEPLMNRLGVLTDAGERVLAKAKSYIEQIVRHYLESGFPRSEVPQWHQCYQMDQILLGAIVQTKHLTYLKNLYNHVHPSSSAIASQFSSIMPVDLEFEYRTHNGREYMMTSTLRPYPQRRKDFEVMVKFGLIGLEKLPKPISAHGKGRAPMGAYLTEQGKRFFEDFQVRYDPQLAKQAELRRTMQSD